MITLSLRRTPLHKYQIYDHSDREHNKQMKNSYSEKIVRNTRGKNKEYLKGGYGDISYILSYYKLCHLAVLFVDRLTSQKHRPNVGQVVQRKPPFFITSRPLISKKSRPHIRKKPAIIQKIRI